MGEFIKDTKLGTCENLYYTSYPQLEKSQMFNSQEKYSFLKVDSGYRFRFPFTDEKISIGYHEDYDRYLLLEVPTNIGVEIHHSDIFTRIGFDNSRGRHKTTNDTSKEFGIRVKCCQDPDNKDAMRWNNSNTLFMGLYQQKYTTQQGGIKLVTCVICPYCGSISQLDESEVKAIIEHYEKLSPSDNKNLVLANMAIALDGYKDQSSINANDNASN